MLAQPLLVLLVLLAGVAAVHRVLRGRAANLWLLLASYGAYACWDWRFLALLAASTLADHVAARRLHAAPDARRRRRWLALSVAVNLGLLGFFKYWNFFAGELGQLLGVLGWQTSWVVRDLVLPLGISFWTFQKLGYVIDVYRGRCAPVTDPLEFALFVAFFPQLLAGPIERARTLLPQLRAPRRPGVAALRGGAWLILLGLYKKLAVADPLAAELVDPLFAGQPRGADALLAGVLFAVQVYADFAAYTDLARGAARLVGIELVTNFRAPYLAENLQDFWSRWHASLSAWIKDYVYFPLALGPVGRRFGAAGATVITMTLMGLWHGASWTHVLWGLYHGLLLAALGRLRPALHRLRQVCGPLGGRPWRLGAIAVTFGLVAIGELLFRARDLGHSAALAGGLVGGPAWSERTPALVLGALELSWLIFVLDVVEVRSGEHEAPRRWPRPLRLLLHAVLLAAILGCALRTGVPDPRPFVYFQF